MSDQPACRPALAGSLALFCALAGTFVTHASAQLQSPTCQVTRPNGVAARGQELHGNIHGGEGLSVLMHSSDGVITFKPHGPGFVEADGSLVMKVPWHRGDRGQLSITGRRLDGPAAPLRARIPTGYGEIGFQSAALIFPTPGCWEVTGRVGGAQLTFVSLVVKIGDGPRAGAK